MGKTSINLSELDNIDYEILRLAADGHTLEDTAESLFLGGSTIEKRRAKICEELRAKNITQAVAKALRKKLIN